MKLYFTPGACSMAPHIGLREAGLKFDLEQVDLGTKKTKSGDDYTKINPKGYVPALQLDSGEVLTEAPVILQYIGDQKPDSGLVPKAGTMERYRTQEWLNFVTSELHKGFGALFNPKTPEDYRPVALERIGMRLDFLAKQLDGKPYLAGVCRKIRCGNHGHSARGSLRNRREGCCCTWCVDIQDGPTWSGRRHYCGQAETRGRQSDRHRFH